MKRQKTKKQSNFERGVELVCQKFDVAAEKEIDWWVF